MDPTQRPDAAVSIVMGPRGFAGPQGPAGEPGPPGDPGADADLGQLVDDETGRLREQLLPASVNELADQVAQKVDQDAFDDAIQAVETEASATATIAEQAAAELPTKADKARQTFIVLDYIPANVDLTAVLAGTVDVSDYVQAATNAAGAAGGGDVWFTRPGRYRLDGTYTAAGLVWAVANTFDNVRHCFVNGAVVTTTKDTVPFFLSGAGKPAGMAGWRNYWLGDPTKATYYGVAPVTRGDLQLTFTTPAHAGNFAKGDILYLRTGQCNDAGTSGTPEALTEPQAEMLKAAADGNPSTGVVLLEWATEHSYQQEYFLAGAGGKTSTDSAGGTRTAAVFGAAKVTDRVALNQGLINYQLDALPARYGFALMGVSGMVIDSYRARLGGSPFNAIEWHNFVARNLDMTIDAATPGSTRWFLTGATGCTYGRFENIKGKAVGGRAGIAHFHEACANVKVRGLDIYTVAGNDSANLTPLSVRARASVEVEDATIVSRGSGTPVYVDSTCTQGGALRRIAAVCSDPLKGVRVSAPRWTLTATPDTPVVVDGDARAPQVPAQVEYLTGVLRYDTPSIVLGVLPANAMVLGTQIQLDVRTAFDDTGNDRITVGYDGGENAYVISAAALDLGTTGRKDISTAIGGSAGIHSGTKRTVKAYYVGQNANATAGKAVVVVPYLRLPALT